MFGGGGILIRDGRKIATWTIIGALGGAFYQMSNIFIDNMFGNLKLDPPTDAIQRDKPLLSLFSRLQDFRKINEVEFRQSVASADRLLYLCDQIERKEISPKVDDRTYGFSQYKESRKHLQSFYDSCKQGSAQDQVAVQQIIEAINLKIKEHMENLMFLTSGTIPFS